MCHNINKSIVWLALYAMFHSSLFIHKTHVWNWMKRFDTNLSFLLFVGFLLLPIPFLAYSSNNNNIFLPQDTLQYQRIDERVVMNHYSHQLYNNEIKTQISANRIYVITKSLNYTQMFNVGTRMLLIIHPNCYILNFHIIWSTKYTNNIVQTLMHTMQKLHRKLSNPCISVPHTEDKYKASPLIFYRPLRC